MEQFTNEGKDMNERIRKLIEQATTKREFYPEGCNGYPKYRYDFDQEKFAELIVRECADVAKETRWAVPPSQEQIARGIQQHFGVES